MNDQLEIFPFYYFKNSYTDRNTVGVLNDNSWPDTEPSSIIRKTIQLKTNTLIAAPDEAYLAKELHSEKLHRIRTGPFARVFIRLGGEMPAVEGITKLQSKSLVGSHIKNLYTEAYSADYFLDSYIPHPIEINKRDGLEFAKIPSDSTLRGDDYFGLPSTSDSVPIFFGQTPQGPIGSSDIVNTEWENSPFPFKKKYQTLPRFFRQKYTTPEPIELTVDYLDGSTISGEFTSNIGSVFYIGPSESIVGSQAIIGTLTEQSFKFASVPVSTEYINGVAQGVDITTGFLGSSVKFSDVYACTSTGAVYKGESTLIEPEDGVEYMDIDLGSYIKTGGFFLSYPTVYYAVGFKHVLISSSLVGMDPIINGQTIPVLSSGGTHDSGKVNSVAVEKNIYSYGSGNRYSALRYVAVGSCFPDTSEQDLSTSQPAIWIKNSDGPDDSQIPTIVKNPFHDILDLNSAGGKINSIVYVNNTFGFIACGILNPNDPNNPNTKRGFVIRIDHNDNYTSELLHDWDDPEFDDLELKDIAVHTMENGDLMICAVGLKDENPKKENTIFCLWNSSTMPTWTVKESSDDYLDELRAVSVDLSTSPPSFISGGDKAKMQRCDIDLDGDIGKMEWINDDIGGKSGSTIVSPKQIRSISKGKPWNIRRVNFNPEILELDFTGQVIGGGSPVEFERQNFIARVTDITSNTIVKTEDPRDPNNTIDAISVSVTPYGGNIIPEGAWYTRATSSDELRAFFGFGDGMIVSTMGISSISPEIGYLPIGRKDAPSYKDYKIVTEANSIETIRLIGPAPRGFSYGVMNVTPTPSKCIFRRNHYGHFRDMLEQRPMAKYYSTSEGNDASSQVPVVRVHILEDTREGELIKEYMAATEPVEFNWYDSGIYDVEYRAGQPFFDYRDI